MADKSLQEQKRELLKNLENRRASISDGTQRLTGNVKSIPSQAKSSLTGGTSNGLRGTQDGRIPFNNPFKARNITPAQPVKKGAAGLLSKTPSLLRSLGNIGARRPFSLSRSSSATGFRLPSAETPLPVKPIMIGLGALLVIGFLSGSRKKKKKARARQKEQKTLAKYGVGFFLIKWLLGASQPAIRHVITKQVKKRILK